MRILLLMVFLGIWGCRSPEGVLNSPHEALQLNATLLPADPSAGYKEHEVQVTLWNRGDTDVLIAEDHADWKTILIDPEGALHLPHHTEDPERYTTKTVNPMRKLKAGESFHYRSKIGRSFPLKLKPGEYRVIVIRKMLNQELHAETAKRLVIP